MKKLLYFLLGSIIFVAILASCNSTSKISKQELTKFTTTGDTIYYENNAFAYFTHIEYEYYRGDKRIEVSITQLSMSTDKITDELVEYIHIKHPKVKVEVKIPYQKYK